MQAYAAVKERAGGGETGHPGEQPPQALKSSRKSPKWAKLCVIIGAVLMVVSGGVVASIKVAVNVATGDLKQEDLLGTDREEGANIDGAINILLLGMDERKNNDLIRTDSIIIAHIPASHDAIYMVSIPRDSRVEIPAFSDTNYAGGTDKINAAFAMGNRKNGQGDSSTEGRQRGVRLLVKTLKNLVPGGITFNAVGIINFEGFRDILKALGGVYMCIDTTVESEHYDSTGKYHTSTRKENVRNKKTYKKGTCRHFEAWEALDYARQREGVTGGDYARQRHQQQMLMAIFKELTSKGTLTNPSKFNELKSAAGKLLTLDLGGQEIIDWIFTLKGLDASAVTMIKTNGGNFNSQLINGQSFEVLSDDSMKLLKAVHDDTVYEFLVAHPSWIAKDK